MRLIDRLGKKKEEGEKRRRDKKSDRSSKDEKEKEEDKEQIRKVGVVLWLYTAHTNVVVNCTRNRSDDKRSCNSMKFVIFNRSIE